MIAIAAVSQSWGIGRDGDMLFHIPADLKYFRDKTMGKTVIMGRLTLESLPGGKPLDGRENIVISRSENYSPSGVLVCRSVADAVAATSAKPSDEVFVIGGGMIYSELLNYCEKAYITRIDADPKADVYFPNLDELPDWELVSDGEKLEHKGITFSFAEYRNMTF